MIRADHSQTYICLSVCDVFYQSAGVKWEGGRPEEMLKKQKKL